MGCRHRLCPDDALLALHSCQTSLWRPMGGWSTRAGHWDLPKPLRVVPRTAMHVVSVRSAPDGARRGHCEVTQISLAEDDPHFRKWPAELPGRGENTPCGVFIENELCSAVDK